MGFKKNISAFLIISILGTISHFVYALTGENRIIGLIFPVNESVWEHLKLIYFPSLLYFAIEYFFIGKEIKNYTVASIKGIFCGMLSVVVLFYTLNGILGKNIDFLNILIFFIAVFTELKKRNQIILCDKEYSKTAKLLYYSAFIVTGLLFMLWSFQQPNLNIFVSP